jgi:hypothetical protein
LEAERDDLERQIANLTQAVRLAREASLVPSLWKRWRR